MDSIKRKDVFSIENTLGIAGKSGKIWKLLVAIAIFVGVIIITAVTVKVLVTKNHHSQTKNCDDGSGNCSPPVINYPALPPYQQPEDCYKDDVRSRCEPTVHDDTIPPSIQCCDALKHRVDCFCFYQDLRDPAYIPNSGDMVDACQINSFAVCMD